MTTHQLGTGVADAAATGERAEHADGGHDSRVARSTTTLGVLLVAINASLVLIALPDIARGIRMDPLLPGSSGYLLWLVLGFLVGPAVLGVTFARLGDRYGHVRLRTLGFAGFTACSILLTVTWMHGAAGAMWVVVLRVLQGVSGALLVANFRPNPTEASTASSRQPALRSRSVAVTSGVFLGLVVGGLLAPVNWRLVFLVSVPLGLLGTIRSSRTPRDVAQVRRDRIDWQGTTAFGVGLLLVLLGITYGVQPHGDRAMGWTNPYVVAAVVGGLGVLAAFVAIETRVPEPMFRLQLFRSRAFTTGTAASVLSALGAGGLLLVLILWLQAIWLPLHGYSGESTPLWAALCLLPLVIGYLGTAPLAGYLSDHFGARPFATGGMLVAALSFLFLLLLPVNFNYWSFAAILLLSGIGLGLFAAPNRTATRNGLPAPQRVPGGLVAGTLRISAHLISLGILFGLVVVGLASTLSATVTERLTGAGVPVEAAQRAADIPPVAALSASLLGDNPTADLLAPPTANLDPQQLAYVTGPQFLPSLISEPFQDGLNLAFGFAIVACLAAAAASSLRGGTYRVAEGAAFDSATAAPPIAVPATTAADTAPLPQLIEPQPAAPLRPAPPPAPEAAVAPPDEVDQPPDVGPRLIGAVRDSDDRPVPDAVLTLTDPGQPELARTRTDRDGHFTLEAIDADPTGEYVVVLSGRTVDPVARVVRLDGETEAVGLDLHAPSSRGAVAGRLVRSDAPSEPVPDGTIVLTERGTVVARTRTDSSGSFLLDGVPAGEHVLTAAAPGAQPRTTLVRLRPHERAQRELAVPTAVPAADSGAYPDEGRPAAVRRVT